MITTNHPLNPGIDDGYAQCSNCDDVVTLNLIAEYPFKGIRCNQCVFCDYCGDTLDVLLRADPQATLVVDPDDESLLVCNQCSAQVAEADEEERGEK